MRLADLQQYDPALHTGRAPASDAAWDGGLHDSYVPREDDEIELSVALDPEGSWPLLTVRTLGALTLIHDVSSARLTVRLLRAVRSITVQPHLTNAQPRSVNTDFAIGATWGTIRGMLQSAPLDCGKCRLLASLRPVTRVLPRPGDSVAVHRSFSPLEPTGETNPRLVSETFPTVVDPEGYVRVPMLAAVTGRISELSDTGDRDVEISGKIFGRPGLRLAGTEVDQAYSRVRAWAPDWTPAQAPTWAELGDCLSVATASTRSVDACPADRDVVPELSLPGNFAARCERYGVTDHFRPCSPNAGTMAIGLHYQFDPTAPSWTLVDERGRRLDVALQHGATVGDMTRQFYPALVGRELLARRSTRAYATVLPDRRTSNANPFYVVVTYDGASPADALLVPGDTVFISRTRPRRTR